MDYLDRLPAAIQPGKVLVHNRAQSAQSLGMNGFRAWLVDAADRRHARRELCDCGWAPELGPHYRGVSPDEGALSRLLTTTMIAVLPSLATRPEG